MNIRNEESGACEPLPEWQKGRVVIPARLLGDENNYHLFSDLEI